jgi:DHA1 family inner membrane transport protein
MIFTGLAIPDVLGGPFSTWLCQVDDWRAAPWPAGVAVFLVVALAVPGEAPSAEAPEFSRNLNAPMGRPVRLTIPLGYVGLFAVSIYIAPPLIEAAGVPEGSKSPKLL